MSTRQEIEPIGRSIILPGCRPSPVGLVWIGEPSAEEMRDIGLALQRCERSSAWWHGDYLCKQIDRDMAEEAERLLIEFETAEERRGRMRKAVRAYAKGRGLEEAVCAMYLWVANFFPVPTRVGGLTHYHHRVCWEAGISLSEAERWLAKALTAAWSASKLRAEINATRLTPEVEEPDFEDDIPRELSQFECWAATRWTSMQAVQPLEAVRLLDQMPTAARLVDHLRAVAGSGPSGGLQHR